MEANAEILEPLELKFSDLLILSSAASSRVSSSPQELERLEAISNSVMQALGPSGPGLLSITGVPGCSGNRRTLLPLARKLALLGDKDRARVLKEHGLGSDVPLKNLDRIVSSFALQLKYGKSPSMESSSGSLKATKEESPHAEENLVTHKLHEFHDYEFKQLGDTFKDLGLCMMELGLRLARICDRAIGGRELEQSITESLTAKGRLIHYHSTLDNLILKEINRKTKGSAPKTGSVTLFPLHCSGSTTSGNKVVPEPGRKTLDDLTSLQHLQRVNSSTEGGCNRAFSNLWQQWHYDYGIFTVLTTPLFTSSCQAEGCPCLSSFQECSSPDGHTYLQLFDTNRNKILVVKSPPESFIIQVGEAADILSGGKLRSTLHSVGRPLELENLGRETFVVFLQPAWGKTLSYSALLLDAETRSQEELSTSDEASQFFNKEDASPSAVAVESQDSYRLIQEILRKIPPISSRLRDGMTFAEFSRETTKQYYGGSGTQSKRD